MATRRRGIQNNNVYAGATPHVQTPRHDTRRRDPSPRSVVFTAFAIGAMASAIVGFITLTGGSNADPTVPEFSKPEGYAFHEWRLEETIRFCVDPEGGPDVGESLFDLAQKAVGAWQYAAAGKLPLAVDGLCPGRGLAQGDDVNVIGWNSMRGLGVAYVQPDSKDAVREADIAIQSLDVYPNAGCTLSILLHEVGHVVAVAHQPEDDPSIMTSSSVCKPQLSWRDIAAVRYMYR